MKKTNNLPKYYALILVLIALGITIFSITQNNFFKLKHRSSSPQKEVLIITTLFPFYDFVKQISPDHFQVELLNTAQNFHHFNPTPLTIKKIIQAHVVISASENIENWLLKLKDNAPHTVKFIDLSVVLNNHNQHQDNQHQEHSHLDFDPHYWLDFKIDKKIISYLEEQFFRLFPENKSIISSKAKSLKIKLEELDKQYQLGLKNCFSKHFYLIGHDSFSYLAKNYGLTYSPFIKNTSTESVPTLKTMLKLINDIKKKTNYVFYEEYGDPKLKNNLAQILKGVNFLPLNTGEIILTDQKKESENFFTLMKKNLVNLQIGLNCKSKY